MSNEVPLPTYGNTKNKLRALRRRAEHVKFRMVEEPDNQYLVAEYSALNAAVEAMLYVRDVRASRERLVARRRQPTCHRTIVSSGHGEIVCALPSGHENRCMSSTELLAEADPHRKR